MNIQNRTQRKASRAASACAAAVLLSAGLFGMGRAAQAHGRDDSPIFTDTFEMDANGWTALGPHASVGTTNEADKVKSGKNALVFNYRIDSAPAAPGELAIDVLLRPLHDGEIAQARSISFWARSDSSAPLALALTETNGGRYLATFWLPKNKWAHVVLAPEDFVLSEGKDDPKDPNGKLDLDQVSNIGLVNLHSFIAQSLKAAPENATLFPLQNGPRALWLDDFTISRASVVADAPEPAPPAEKSGMWLDAMRHDTLAWLPLGGVEMQMDKAAPTKGRALRLDYTQEMGKITAAQYALNHRDLSRFDHLEFDIASSKASKVILILEEKSGARYQIILDVAGDSAPSRKAVFFSSLALANDSPKDPNGKLDPDQIKQITFVDISAFLNMPSQANTLWIGPIRASQSK